MLTILLVLSFVAGLVVGGGVVWTLLPEPPPKPTAEDPMIAVPEPQQEYTMLLYGADTKLRAERTTHTQTPAPFILFNGVNYRKDHRRRDGAYIYREVKAQ